MKNWKPYKFGSFLNRVKRFEERNDFIDYTFSGTYSYAKGIFKSYTKPGVEFNLSRIQRIKKDDFIFCKIMAWEGAFGIAPEECDNTVMSGAFVAYEVDKRVADPKFLDYYFKIEKNWRKVGSGSTGTNVRRKTLFPEDFESFEIPLPPLPEQKRTISKIESITAKLEKIKEFRAEQTKDINNLLFSKYSELIEDAEWLPMSKVAPIIRREVNINEDALYPELGIRCFGKGTFHKPAITGLEVGTKTLYQIKKRDLVFSNVFAWEGGIAVAKEDDNDRYGSHRFISCVVNKEKASEEFLCFHFLSPKGLEDINACSPGGAGRNKTLGLDKLMRIKVPVPDIDLQEEFVELLHKVSAIKNHHLKTEQELNALLPSLLDKAFKGEL